jgi:thiamine biosynthesis lipoprotein
MGVPFRIVLYAPDVIGAEAGAKAVFARLSQLNSRLSDYDYGSELNRLSRTSGSGQVVKLSEDLWRVLARAQQMSRRSQGAFDVTVGPCVNLWRKARREGRLPDPARLAAARQAVGYRRLRLDAQRRTACLLVADMRLDLGGIAKGYALDEALKVLYAHGLRRALVTGGGDMAAGEPPPGKRGWRIEVAPPDVTNAPPPCYLSLARAGLATSGDLFQHLEIAGQRYSHILDPRTGVGLTDHSLVTVIARDGMTADSLATAVSVVGPTGGRRLVEAAPGAAARIVRKPGQQVEVVTTSRFSKYLP